MLAKSYTVSSGCHVNYLCRPWVVCGPSSAAVIGLGLEQFTGSLSSGLPHCHYRQHDKIFDKLSIFNGRFKGVKCQCGAVVH